MRCLALAEALKKRGASVKFISRRHVGNLNHLISKKGFQTVELPQPRPSVQSNSADGNIDMGYSSWLGVDEMQDATESIHSLVKEKPDWLILDHYALGERWEKALRPYVRNIMVVDDLANRRHDCDLLLDQNWFDNMDTRYDDLVAEGCTKLLGPKYALLRPEFAKARKKLKVKSGKIERLLVFFGGSDLQNLTGKTLMALSEPDLAYLLVDVVIGENNTNRNDIQQLVQLREHTLLHVQAADMASIMSRADIAIGAGGATTWERMCLDLESHVIISADNQREVNEQLAKHGYIVLIGFADSMNPAYISTHIRKRIFENKHRLRDFVSICDGMGVEHVIEKLISLGESIEIKGTAHA